MEEGLAVTATVGAGGGGGGAGDPAAPTATVTLPELLPPAPIQVTVNVVFEVRPVFVKLPVTPVPPPLAEEQLVALVEVQLMIELPPLTTEPGFAVTFTVGNGAELPAGLGVGGGVLRGGSFA